ncbi:hypothetical protein GGI04_005473 [Coemansia thaxteri]|uniref:Peptidase S1 domain-containing protein n=1 Tax=Coemansia thaxteri TaxID=2663907 RepID=A0A9W8BNE2_9FUNG|nr:hypothetical protein GGI04_005473 [Coemansia thaxteri]KAJ2006770.1 hypothetical protein H4R26_001184 [Coemansia thaxteri]KAJ2464414.1 hypothetical protein GGI02_004996 [Coemansia sp. RSA 2322]KAJ2486597.1 hypothetical protein EV174_001021 [Coemansia sp. RSA 2320]
MYGALLLLLIPATLGMRLPGAKRPLIEDERIIGGISSMAGEYPYIVSLNLTLPEGSGLCGGTLITNRIVVTAAHCVYDLDQGTVVAAKNVRVGLGSQSRKRQKFVQAQEVHVNPEFEPPVISGDIALIVIEPVELSKFIQVARIFNGNLPEGTKLTAVGWGMTRTDGGPGGIPDSLQQADIVVGSREDCSQFVPGYESSDGPQICTENKLLLGTDTCQGDSGTGVFISVDGRRFLAGLTSYGANLQGDPTCALDDGFGVYTRISYFRKFIDQVAGPHTSSGHKLAA